MEKSTKLQLRGTLCHMISQNWLKFSIRLRQLGLGEDRSGELDSEFGEITMHEPQILD